MKTYNCIRSIALMVVAASFLVPATAAAVPVKYTTVDPSQIVSVGYKNPNGSTWTGSVYTGVYNLEVGDEKTPYRSA